MSAILLLSSLLLVTDSPSASVWPGFLGAGALPIAADSVPLEWAPDRNIAWKADLPGEGQSSPVVWHGHVYLTTVEGPKKDTNHVLAFDLTSGQLLWKHSFPTSQQVEKTLYVSRAAPTSAADAAGVYAFFESGDLVALDHSGKVRWERSLTKDYGPFKNNFGIGSSLAQSEEAIYVLADHEGPSYVMAIRKSDGKNLWKTDRTSRISWSSPAIVTVAGKPELVVSSSGSLDGYDPATGEANLDAGKPGRQHGHHAHSVRRWMVPGRSVARGARAVCVGRCPSRISPSALFAKMANCRPKMSGPPIRPWHRSLLPSFTRDWHTG